MAGKGELTPDSHVRWRPYPREESRGDSRSSTSDLAVAGGEAADRQGDEDGDGDRTEHAADDGGEVQLQTRVPFERPARTDREASGDGKRDGDGEGSPDEDRRRAL